MTEKNRLRPVKLSESIRVISVNKRCDQGYDGASEMSGADSGVQQLISDQEPNASLGAQQRNGTMCEFYEEH